MYIKKGKTNQTADNSEQQEVANKFVLDLPLPQLSTAAASSLSPLPSLFKFRLLPLRIMKS